jgi:membrane-associated phospholipid phosphatase
LATGVTACRIVSGSHFLTDVFAGALIGRLYGWGVPILHNKKSDNNLSFNFTGNGFIASLKF